MRMARHASFCDHQAREKTHFEDWETKPVASRRIGTVAAAIVCLFCAGAAFAEEDCAAASDDCVAVGGWSLSVALGAGVRTNPVVHGQDIPLVVVPQFSYYGKRFFIDNLDPGVTLFEGESNTLSLVASPGYDRVFFYRSDLQNIFIGAAGTGAVAGGGSLESRPPPALVASRAAESIPASAPDRARKVTYLAGPEWTFKRGGLSGQFDFLHEITGRNHGDEVRAAIGVPLGTALAGTWRANFGATWKSAAIVNYYYGYRGLYDANWALDPFAKIGYSRPLGRKWTFDAFVHCERLGDAIASSPIVDRHYVTTAFLGATYVFHK
jgi:outer membrane protein